MRRTGDGDALLLWPVDIWRGLESICGSIERVSNRKRYGQRARFASRLTPPGERHRKRQRLEGRQSVRTDCDPGR